MSKYLFVVPAREYFAADAERRKRSKRTDVCEVVLDTDAKTALFGWRAGDAQSVPMWEDDDFEGALEIVLEHFAKEVL